MVLYKGDHTGHVRADGICPLPCQCDWLQELARLLLKPLVHLAQQRHIPEYLPLYPASVRTGKVVEQKPLCACLPPLTGTLCCFWKPGILYMQVWNCCLEFRTRKDTTDISKHSCFLNDIDWNWRPLADLPVHGQFYPSQCADCHLLSAV